MTRGIAAGWMRGWLEHPLARGRDLDAPSTTAVRREIVRSKPFLRRLYAEWHRFVQAALPEGPGAVVEIGSGGGALADDVPGVIATEVFPCPGVDLVADARRLPFASEAIRAFVLLDVLHHVPDCRAFFADAARCVRPGGRILLVEPWVTTWSRFVYGHLHHEPFDPDAAEWAFPAAGPLSGANGALPWILFERDRGTFEREFPQWAIRSVRPLMPVSYLLSGGVSLRSLAPGWTYRAVRGGETLLRPWTHRLAMFAEIVLERTGAPPEAA